MDNSTNTATPGPKTLIEAVAPLEAASFEHQSIDNSANTETPEPKSLKRPLMPKLSRVLTDRGTKCQLKVYQDQLEQHQDQRAATSGPTGYSEANPRKRPAPEPAATNRIL